jgi:hypothetical protein
MLQTWGETDNMEASKEWCLWKGFLNKREDWVPNGYWFEHPLGVIQSWSIQGFAASKPIQTKNKSYFNWQPASQFLPTFDDWDL